MLALLAALTANDLRPGGFYALGVRQGMSRAEFSSLIQNGSYRSKPFSEDVEWATIEGKDVFVKFCSGRVARAIVDYSSSEWMQSVKVLQAAGFQFIQPMFGYDGGSLNAGQLVFGVNPPKNYLFFVSPLLKVSSYGTHDMPTFQLSFMATGDQCALN